MPPPTWFDESRLDDEPALTVADAVAAPAGGVRGARTPRGRRGRSPRCPRPWRSPASRPAPGRWWPPAPTPGCCAPRWSRGARCRSSRGRTRACPAGPAASTWSSCSPPTAATWGRRPRWPRRSGAAARWSSPARPTRSSPSTRPGRWSTILPTTARDQLATAVLVLEYLDRVDLGPPADHEQVAEALDRVAMSCSPHRDIAVNPAKILAIALADANPVVWGGSVLAARAARRVAESIRRASGRDGHRRRRRAPAAGHREGGAAQRLRRPVQRRARRPAPRPRRARRRGRRPAGP